MSKKIQDTPNNFIIILIFLNHYKIINYHFNNLSYFFHNLYCFIVFFLAVTYKILVKCTFLLLSALRSKVKQSVSKKSEQSGVIIFLLK